MEEQAGLDALVKAAHELNRAGVVWALGASALLYVKGVVETFHDVDLLIQPEHMPAAHKAFVQLGAKAKPASPPSLTYATTFFEEFVLDGVDFDLLGGFTIRRKDAMYRYPFEADRVAEVMNYQGESIPLTPLADWVVLYLLMPRRSSTAVLLARHLKNEPQPEDRAWLSLWLCHRLPGDVREKVLQLYSALDPHA